MLRKKSLKLWQIWHVDFKRRSSRLSDGDRRCYQIIARLVRRENNYWVAVDTTVNPPMWASFAVFDDYGREVEPKKAVSRLLSKRCLHKCFFKTRSLQENMTQGGDTNGKAQRAKRQRQNKKVRVKSQKPGFPLSRE
ncbi:MAG: hypothetical protein ACM3TN_25645 [Alphaproteobacteria bacterium]